MNSENCALQNSMAVVTYAIVLWARTEHFDMPNIYAHHCTHISQYIAFYKWLQQGNSTTHIKHHHTVVKKNHHTTHTAATSTSSSGSSSIDDDSSKQGFGAQAIIHFGMHGK
jgi:hypothetical protein